MSPVGAFYEGESCMPKVARHAVCNETDIIELRSIADGDDYSEKVRRRARCVLRSAEGKMHKDIAAETGMSPNWVSRWVDRYNEEGVAGLMDRPRSGRRGGPAMADVASQVKGRMGGDPPGDGRWTADAVADGLGVGVGTVRDARGRRGADRVGLVRHQELRARPRPRPRVGVGAGRARRRAVVGGRPRGRRRQVLAVPQARRLARRRRLRPAARARRHPHGRAHERAPVREAPAQAPGDLLRAHRGRERVGGGRLLAPGRRQRRRRGVVQAQGGPGGLPLLEGRRLRDVRLVEARQRRRTVVGPRQRGAGAATGRQRQRRQRRRIRPRGRRRHRWQRRRRRRQGQDNHRVRRLVRRHVLGDRRGRGPHGPRRLRPVVVRVGACVRGRPRASRHTRRRPRGAAHRQGRAVRRH